MKQIFLYGSPHAPSYRRGKGMMFAIVGVPDDATLRWCRKVAGAEPELFCSQIEHVGPEALLSFAAEPDDDDFVVLWGRVEPRGILCDDGRAGSDLGLLKL